MFYLYQANTSKQHRLSSTGLREHEDEVHEHDAADQCAGTKYVQRPASSNTVVNSILQAKTKLVESVANEQVGGRPLGFQAVLAGSSILTVALGFSLLPVWRFSTHSYSRFRACLHACSGYWCTTISSMCLSDHPGLSTDSQIPRIHTQRLQLRSE